MLNVIEDGEDGGDAMFAMFRPKSKIPLLGVRFSSLACLSKDPYIVKYRPSPTPAHTQLALRYADEGI